MTARLEVRTTGILAERQERLYARGDRTMLVIFLAQWLLAIGIAVVVTPYTWSGRSASLHMHLKVALGLGALLNLLPALLVATRPGAAVTRHVIAVVQMLWSALLIHLTGGRIETHFHVFGSLAFLTFYRDWRVLPTATLVVIVDHLGRGLLAPESVYGVTDPAWWRFLEHTAWVVFEDIVLVLGCVRQVSDMRGIAQREAELESLNHQIEDKVTERTAELETARRRYQVLVEGTNVVPWEYDAELGRVVYIGPQIESLGFAASQWHTLDFWKERLHPDDRARYVAQVTHAVAEEKSCTLEYRMLAKDGSVVHWRNVISIGRDLAGRRTVRGIAIDVSELKKLESELAHAQKLEAAGQLAAGIAHEINTPVQFVNDSVDFLRGACRELAAIVGRYRRLRAAVQGGDAGAAELADEIERAEVETDLEYNLVNVPKALDLSIEGLGRVSTIVRSMKVFAHPDGEESHFNLNEGLASTLTIARNEYKHVAEVETDLGELPAVRCRAGEMNQVFLNLVVNAAHAIGAAVGDSGRRGKIRVRSRVEDGQIVVSIADDGCGIPEAIRGKVFEQFFTTKPVGKGTGQGLSIARSVVQRHGGTLTFTSEVGRGTTFTVRLPFAKPDAIAA